MESLLQPWPLKCSQCGEEWGSAPLAVIALGGTPSVCPRCLKRLVELIDNPPKEGGTTITFNRWKGEGEGK